MSGGDGYQLDRNSFRGDAPTDQSATSPDQNIVIKTKFLSPKVRARLVSRVRTKRVKK